MTNLSPAAFLINPSHTQPRQAVKAFFGLVEDLDTLQTAYIDEGEGNGPVHDAIEVLEAHVLGYEPQSQDEAAAILSVVHHDIASGMELSAVKLSALARSIAFLGGAVATRFE